MNYEDHLLNPDHFSRHGKNWILPKEGPQQEWPDIGLPTELETRWRQCGFEELLPNEARAIVNEGHIETGTNSAMLAGLLFPSVALAIQSLYDIQRTGRRPMPCSWYGAFIDGSACGKSSAFDVLFEQHRKFHQGQNSGVFKQRFKAEHRSWKRKVKALEKRLDKIEGKPEFSDDKDQLEAEYELLQMSEPQEVRSESPRNL